ncbi:MAG: hypothetical protein WCR42_06220 [bacterium]
MRTIKLAVLALILSTVTMFAQGQPQETKLPDLDITFQAGDLALVYQNLVTVDIKGTEAQAFVEVQNFLKPHIDKLIANKAKTDENVKITMGAQVANYLYEFTQRMTIKGGDAAMLVRFKTAILDAAKATKATK